MPAGVPEGGQWTDAGGGGGRTQSLDRLREEETIELSAASRKSGNGHHYVPHAVVKSKEISEEAAKVFRKAKTGHLFDVRSNKWDTLHRVYSSAVGEALDDYLTKSGTAPQNMTAAQAREFLGKVFESSDPRIRDYNMGIQMREIMQRLLRRGGGGRGTQ